MEVIDYTFLFGLGSWMVGLNYIVNTQKPVGLIAGMSIGIGVVFMAMGYAVRTGLLTF